MAGFGNYTNFVIYENQFWSGVIEVLQRETGVFNQNSAGAIQMVTRDVKGHFEQSSFLKYTSGLVQPRDINANGSEADLTDIQLTQGEFVGVKLNRRIGPVAMSRDTFKKAGFDPNVFSLQVGAQVGEEIAADYADSAISAVRAAIKAQAGLKKDITGDTLPTLNAKSIVQAKQLFGDRQKRLGVLVMHSKPFSDLVTQAIDDKIVNVADVAIYTGGTPTLGLPVVIADSPSLYNVDASSNIVSYDVLILTAGAVRLTESEGRDLATQEILSKENLGMRLQAEHAFNLDVKGCAWDMTNGGKNPSNTALATSTNWDKVVNDLKQMPGVCLTVE